jgi:predicted  nucleic acid-binding Zn-ribbon protein
MNKQIELLRDLEELELSVKDAESPVYPKEELKLRIGDFKKTAEKRRRELSSEIDARLLSEYERIKKRYGSRVVVQVVNEFCGGCYVKLPMELLARKKTELITCPNCGRFLYLVNIKSK